MFPNPTMSRIVSFSVAAMAGALLMVFWIFLTSAAPPDRLVIAEARKLVEERLAELGVLEVGTQPVMVSTDALSTGMSSQAVVIWGRYRPRDNNKNIDPSEERSLFLALVEDGPKTLMATMLGRPPPKFISAILTFDASSQNAMISNLRSEDIFGIGNKQLAFDIVELYADAVGGSPVILQKRGSAWEPVLIRDLSEEIRRTIAQSYRDKSVTYSKANVEYLFADAEKGIVVDRPTFGEKWSMTFNGGIYDFFSFRNSPGTTIRRHSETGKPSLIIGQSLFDDCVMCSHHVFVKAFSLTNNHGQFEWTDDPAWNGGHGFITADDSEGPRLDLDLLLNAGFKMGKGPL